MSRVRAVLRTGAFAGLSAATLAAYEAHRAVSSTETRPELMARYRDDFTDRVLRLFGTELIVNGDPRIEGGALVVANHQSALDIGVVLSVFRGVLVSRHDVADWPLLGRLARHGNTIFVDREDRRSGAAALREIRRRVKERQLVVAFPEGGTFPGDSVHEFHPGTFAAVGSLGAPIIPVGLAYAPAKHMAKVAARPRTRIAVEIGTPLRPGLDARSAAEAARAAVEGLVLQARSSLEGRRP